MDAGVVDGDDLREDEFIRRVLRVQVRAHLQVLKPVELAQQLALLVQTHAGNLVRLVRQHLLVIFLRGFLLLVAGVLGGLLRGVALRHGLRVAQVHRARRLGVVLRAGSRRLRWGALVRRAARGGGGRVICLTHFRKDLIIDCTKNWLLIAITPGPLPPIADTYKFQRRRAKFLPTNTSH